MKFEFILMDQVTLDVEVRFDDGAPYFNHLDPEVEIISVKHNGHEVDFQPIYVDTAKPGQPVKLEPLEDVIINHARLASV